jgi:hypothetical protein
MKTQLKHKEGLEQAMIGFPLKKAAPKAMEKP